MRICLVTPFAWSQPHDVNEHVRGAADALRRRGHDVTVVAPSTRAADLLEGRKILQGHAESDGVIAVGPAVPISRRSQMGVPVGVRANLALALAAGDYDVVHGFEPGLPSLSYLALRETHALTVATFVSRSCSPASTRSLRSPPEHATRRPSVSPATTTCSRPGTTRCSTAIGARRSRSSSSCARTSARSRAP